MSSSAVYNSRIAPPAPRVTYAVPTQYEIRQPVPVIARVPLYRVPYQYGQPLEINSPQAIDNAIINRALSILAHTKNSPHDEKALQALGVNIIYHNGQQALDVIRARGATVEFGDVGDDKTHAIWVSSKNKMLINQKYRGNMSLPVLYAIAEAIYHEAGHAAWSGDAKSSIQEEIDCLALNAMAYRTHVRQDPNYAVASTTGPLKPLFENGVALYPKLFFDPDPQKLGLIDRIIHIYGDLSPESPEHYIPGMPAHTRALTDRVTDEIQRRRAMALEAAATISINPLAQ